MENLQQKISIEEETKKEAKSNRKLEKRMKA